MKRRHRERLRWINAIQLIEMLLVRWTRDWIVNMLSLSPPQIIPGDIIIIITSWLSILKHFCRCEVQTYHVLLAQIQREVLGYDRSILKKNFVDGLKEGGGKRTFLTLNQHFFSEFLRSAEGKPNLCKPAHEVSQSLRIWTLQLLDDLETLVQLSKHVHHRTGKESVLRSLLKLSPGKKGKGRKDETEGAERQWCCRTKQTIMFSALLRLPA